MNPDETMRNDETILNDETIGWTSSYAGEQDDVEHDAQPEPTLVEFSLEDPSLKTKAKQIIYTIFSQLNISEENDLNQIVYYSDSSTTFVHKVAVRFKEKKG